MTDPKFPHYWICDACAVERGGKWPKNHVATMALKPCEYCDGNKQLDGEFIAPYVDYDWPDTKTSHLRD